MTVKELIAELEKHDPERIVILQKDSEGNGFSPLHDLGSAAYRAETTLCGEIGLEVLDDESIKLGYNEEDIIDDGVPALVLAPVN